MFSGEASLCSVAKHPHNRTACDFTLGGGSAEAGLAAAARWLPPGKGASKDDEAEALQAYEVQLSSALQVRAIV